MYRVISAWNGAETGVCARITLMSSPDDTRFPRHSPRLRRYGSLDALGPFPMRLSITLWYANQLREHLFSAKLRVSRVSLLRAFSCVKLRCNAADRKGKRICRIVRNKKLLSSGQVRETDVCVKAG